jgi:hypothetical protein
MATQKRCVLFRMRGVATAGLRPRPARPCTVRTCTDRPAAGTALAGHSCPDSRTQDQPGQGGHAFPLTCTATLTGTLVPPRLALYAWLFARRRFCVAGGRRTPATADAAGRARFRPAAPAKYVRLRNSQGAYGSSNFHHVIAIIATLGRPAKDCILIYGKYRYSHRRWEYRQEAGTGPSKGGRGGEGWREPQAVARRTSAGARNIRISRMPPLASPAVSRMPLARSDGRAPQPGPAGRAR